jgi:glycosyltransferase involved in cell wall biosynthesis
MIHSILFVFLDYPPKSGPGSNRNFYLKQHFSTLGWKTKVLTMEQLEDESDDSFVDDQDVIRAFGKDATQVFSIKGKYPKIVETPDRWYLWILPALIKGLRQNRKTPFDFIYAGFPAYSSVIVGLLLSKILRKPLALDLRDPFRFRYDPKNMPVHWLYRWLEKKAIKQSYKLITTTQACATYYQKLYPNFPKKDIIVIQNGFAKEFHQQLPINILKKKAIPFVLLHSGVLYEIGRNPEVLLLAIQRLRQKGVILRGQFTLRFRGANVWPALAQRIQDLALTDYIEFSDRISYREAIQEMRTVNANVLIQNSLFNLQIPSKLYDILALKKPILAITDEHGALAKEMTYLNVPYFSDSVEKTAIMLRSLISDIQRPLTEDALECRNRFSMNQKLSQALKDTINS